VSSAVNHVRGETGHVPAPLAGSCVTECKICHRRINLRTVLQMEWQHAPLVPAVTSGDAA
jgi:hypothetical protein